MSKENKGDRKSVTGGVLASRTPASGSEPETLVTDAEVDAGNSGGPLLTSCGEALGVIVRREPLIYTVRTVSVGAATALPFVLSAVNASATPATPTSTATSTPATVTPPPAGTPAPATATPTTAPPPPSPAQSPAPPPPATPSPTRAP